jgi:hypothetical protein
VKRGYRAWTQELQKYEQPRLVSPSYSGYVWVPGENVSDWPGAKEQYRGQGTKRSPAEQIPEEEAFKQSSHGFYSRKRLEDLIREGYFSPGQAERIAGEIVPYGKVLEGESGYRSEKAEISGLFEDPTVRCEICRRNPVEAIVELEGITAHVCNECYKKIKKASSRSQELKERSWWAIKHALASYYDVPLMDLPEEARKLK